MLTINGSRFRGPVPLLLDLLRDTKDRCTAYGYVVEATPRGFVATHPTMADVSAALVR